MESLRQNRRFVSASITMGLLTASLFFIPIVNGVVGGAVGGYKVASPLQAVYVVLVVIPPLAIVLYLIYSTAGAPVFGVPYHPSVITLISTGCVGLLLGAVLGGIAGAARGSRVLP